MATIKAHTDVPQSKKLAEILPIDSADMGLFYSSNPNAARNQMWVGTKAENADIPCWSLTALLGVLPKIGAEEPMVKKLYYANEPKERYICEYGLTNITSEYDNPIDACYELILKLNELKIL